VNECCSFLTIKPKYNAFIICCYSNREAAVNFAIFFHFLAAKNFQPYPLIKSSIGMSRSDAQDVTFLRKLKICVCLLKGSVFKKNALAVIICSSLAGLMSVIDYNVVLEVPADCKNCKQ